MATTRRLAAILAADVARYSRLMGADEEGTLNALKQLRPELADPKITEHNGRIVKTTGDGLLVEFASVVDAVRCAVAVQRGMAERDVAVPVHRRIEFRIGINLGDIIIEDEDIFGDGVNVAARLEALAESGGICVSRVVRDQVRDKLDFAFDDQGEQQVKNIARPVHIYRILIGGGQCRAEITPSASRQPSIAVLPFANMSGDPEREYFADGMVEEIITALSRIHWLFLIARNSTFTYKGRAVSVKQVGRELGVRYRARGLGAQGGKAGAHHRVADRCPDRHAPMGRSLRWLAGRCVRTAGQGRAVSIAGVVEPTVQVAEMRRSAARRTTDLSAYDLYLRALAAFFPNAKERTIQALGLLEQAIAIDPHYGPALAQAAFCHLQPVRDRWVDAPETSRRKAIGLARQALQVAENDPGIVANAAVVLARFGEDIGAMVGLVDRALALNPSFARGW